jgi:hypothetical protein
MYPTLICIQPSYVSNPHIYPKRLRLISNVLSSSMCTPSVLASLWQIHGPPTFAYPNECPVHTLPSGLHAGGAGPRGRGCECWGYCLTSLQSYTVLQLLRRSRSHLWSPDLQRRAHTTFHYFYQDWSPTGHGKCVFPSSSSLPPPLGNFIILHMCRITPEMAVVANPCSLTPTPTNVYAAF